MEDNLGNGVELLNEINISKCKQITIFISA